MKAIDMTPIIKKYRGYFVALSRDRKKVYGKGRVFYCDISDEKL